MDEFSTGNKIEIKNEDEHKKNRHSERNGRRHMEKEEKENSLDPETHHVDIRI